MLLSLICVFFKNYILIMMLARPKGRKKSIWKKMFLSWNRKSFFPSKVLSAISYFYNLCPYDDKIVYIPFLIFIISWTQRKLTGFHVRALLGCVMTLCSQTTVSISEASWEGMRLSALSAYLYQRRFLKFSWGVSVGLLGCSVDDFSFIFFIFFFLMALKLLKYELENY